MTSKESDSKDFDWTEVERAVEQELLERAQRVAQRLTARVRRATPANSRTDRLSPNDPTDECPAVV